MKFNNKTLQIITNALVKLSCCAGLITALVLITNHSNVLGDQVSSVLITAIIGALGFGIGYTGKEISNELKEGR